MLWIHQTSVELAVNLLHSQGLVLTTCIVFHVCSSANRISPEYRTRLFLALNQWFALPPKQSAILQCLAAVGSRRLPVVLPDGREFERQCPSRLPPFSSRSGCKDE